MKSFVIICILVFMISCESWFDNTFQEGVPIELALQTEEDLIAAKIACYDALQDENYYGRAFWILGDLISDNVLASGTKLEYYDIDRFQFNADNLLIEGVWNAIYASIHRVNYLLKYAEEMPINEELKKGVFSEIKFLRALGYFNLQCLFGEVPLYTEPVLELSADSYKGRCSIEQIDSLILEDLNYARINSNEQSLFFVNENAIKALLARFYLFKNQYDLAEYFASFVIQEYTLEENYQLLFQESENAQGIIWALQFNPNDKNRLAEYYFPTNLGGRFELQPDNNLFLIFEDNDTRKSAGFGALNDLIYCNKYRDIHTGANQVLIFRLAEMLLIRAEANLNLKPSNYQQLIRNDINLLRNRANASFVTSNDDDQLLQIIIKERRMEFCFENQRWYDLIRNEMQNVIMEMSDDHPLLLPIPQSEIQLNPKISSDDQNYGY